MLVHVVIASPLTASYDGPYKAILRSGRAIKILMKGKVETVTVDHVKPAHFEREPESGTTTVFERTQVFPYICDRRSHQYEY